MIRLDNVSYRSGGRLLLSDITIDFSEGSCWAITGGNGSGKTLLAMITAGLLKPSAGKVIVEGKTGYASFELQQRIMAEERKKDNSRFMQGGVDPGTLVKDFIFSKTADTGSVAADNGSIDMALFDRYSAMFSLEKITGRGLRFLSTGEFRKVLLCRELLAKPDILVVDDPYDGLDVKSRENLQQVFEALVKAGERIFLVTPRKSEVPQWAQYCAVLENGKVTFCGKNPFAAAQESIPLRNGTKTWQGNAVLRVQNTSSPGKDGAVIAMNNVSVSYDGVKILSGINWQVLRGERWKITGPNGCGKSTLMALINGDNPKAYSNDIKLFGRKRGSGETVWEIKKKVGFVSGDFQMNYRVRASVLDTVLSGFFDSVGLYNDVSGLQMEEALKWLEAAGLAGKKEMRFTELSWGEKRAVLIIRALVKRAELVILDEPCQGLDDANTAAVLDIIAMLSGFSDITILLVTHDMHVCPPGFDRHLEFHPHPDGGFTVSSPEK